MATSKFFKIVLMAACWYDDDGILVTQPTAFLRMPIAKDGKPVDVVLEARSPDDKKADSTFIRRWQQLAHENNIPFEDLRGLEPLP